MNISGVVAVIRQLSASGMNERQVSDQLDRDGIRIHGRHVSVEFIRSVIDDAKP